jgi:hypothetical protein
MVLMTFFKHQNLASSTIIYSKQSNYEFKNNSRQSSFLSTSSLLAFSQSPQQDYKLWYKKPASSWNEALPIGNGRLAAMVFGILQSNTSNSMKKRFGLDSLIIMWLKVKEQQSLY